MNAELANTVPGVGRDGNRRPEFGLMAYAGKRGKSYAQQIFARRGRDGRMMDMAMNEATVEAVLIDADAAARMCGMHRATWYRKHSAGLTPKDVRIGGVVRWRKGEIEDWIAAGCPARVRWESMRTKK